MNAKVPSPGVAAAPKRVLLLDYSQTGQLTRIAERIVAPLCEDPGIRVHVEPLRPARPYPFPWPLFDFLDAFPESAHMVPPQLLPVGLRGDEDFDLVIVPYQVWFLAPSPPIVAFLKDPLAARLLRGKPVVTVIACRNMWMLAHDKMRGLLADCGARLLDNVVLVDPGPTLVTLLTTPAWLLSGRRDLIRGLPPAGIDPAGVAGARRFGLALRAALRQGRERGGAPLLDGLRAVDSDPRLLLSETVGTRSFFVWGRLLRAVGRPGQLRRRPVLLIYLMFLLAMIVTVVPVSLALQVVLRPLLRRRLAAIKQRYDAPSGGGDERMPVYGA